MIIIAIFIAIAVVVHTWNQEKQAKGTMKFKRCQDATIRFTDGQTLVRDCWGILRQESGVSLFNKRGQLEVYYPAHTILSLEVKEKKRKPFWKLELNKGK